MKKLILSLTCVTFVCTAFAANCVSVKQTGTGYANHKITIALTRSGCTGDATNHRNTVWVFVDYRTVTGATKGAWTRATISVTSTGTVVNSGSSKGVWIYGANGTQTVTLTLSGMPAKYDWCAFATDYPPNAAAYSSGKYTLKGTAPFIINGNTPVTGNTYSGTVNAITDATGCPGWIERDVPTAGGNCRPGLTLVGGYCRNLAADGASTYVGCGLEIKAADAAATYRSEAQLAANPPCPGGWRTPSHAELVCMCEHKSNIGGFPTTYAAREWYLSSTRADYMPNEEWGYRNNLMCHTIPGGGHGLGVSQDANVCGVWAQSIDRLFGYGSVPEKPTRVRCVR